MNRAAWRAVAWRLGLDYPANLLKWWCGWFQFERIDFRRGWNAGQLRWWALYALDYLACVLLLAGAVETVSRFAQDHRRGWVWDKLLDAIERFDAEHGARAGPPLWDSVRPPLWVRVLVPAAWLAWGIRSVAW